MERLENIGRPLVQLTRQPIRYIKLKQQMTRRQRHFLKISNVPRVDDMPAAVRVCPYLIDYVLDLINRIPIYNLQPL